MATASLPINRFRDEGRGFCAKPINGGLRKCTRDHGHDGDCAHVRRRLLSCVAAWPEAETCEYNPSCCRFPGSCSATAYDPYYVPTDAVEPDPTPTTEREPSSMSESSGIVAGNETTEQPGAMRPDSPIGITSGRTVTVAIGNSDDGLSQSRWSEYVTETSRVIRAWADHVHGEFLTAPASPHQSACWIIEVETNDEKIMLAKRLQRLATDYEQDSIAFVVGVSTLLPAKP